MEQEDCFGQNPDCTNRNCVLRRSRMDKPAIEGHVQYCPESEGVDTGVTGGKTAFLPGEVCRHAVKAATFVQAERQGGAEPAEVR